MMAEIPTMRIAYVAKHESGGNDDEGAIYHALTSLGHTVERLREERGHVVHKMAPCDFLLCHNWQDFDSLGKFSMPKVCWYFDLVSFPDSTLHARNARRAAWALRMEESADLLFCTDGDWVASRHSPKVLWLPQGADERVAGAGWAKEQDVPILFTGGANGGEGRASFVAEMRERYGPAFCHVARGAHGRALADLIVRSKIVVAPDAPVTDRYHSNRVYLTLGLQGFLLHPYTEAIREQYTDGLHLEMYHDRDQLHKLIDYYLPRHKERAAIASSGLARTLNAHTYRHRCEQMIATVRERLGL